MDAMASESPTEISSMEENDENKVVNEEQHKEDNTVEIRDQEGKYSNFSKSNLERHWIRSWQTSQILLRS
jgi:hypothetical protein